MDLAVSEVPEKESFPSSSSPSRQSDGLDISRLGVGHRPTTSPQGPEIQRLVILLVSEALQGFMYRETNLTRIVNPNLAPISLVSAIHVQRIKRSVGISLG